jgi:hypothetical protein
MVALLSVPSGRFAVVILLVGLFFPPALLFRSISSVAFMFKSGSQAPLSALLSLCIGC